MFTICISTIACVVVTVCEHIITDTTLTSRYKRVRIDESTDLRIVVATLEIIQPGLYVVVLAIRLKSGRKATLWIAMESEDSMAIQELMY